MSSASCAARAAARIQIGVAVGDGAPAAVRTRAGPMTNQAPAIATSARPEVVRRDTSPGTAPTTTQAGHQRHQRRRQEEQRWHRDQHDW